MGSLPAERDPFYQQLHRLEDAHQWLRFTILARLREGPQVCFIYPPISWIKRSVCCAPYGAQGGRKECSRASEHGHHCKARGSKQVAVSQGRSCVPKETTLVRNEHRGYMVVMEQKHDCNSLNMFGITWAKKKFGQYLSESNSSQKMKEVKDRKCLRKSTTFSRAHGTTRPPIVILPSNSLKLFNAWCESTPGLRCCSSPTTVRMHALWLR